MDAPELDLAADSTSYSQGATDSVASHATVGQGDSVSSPSDPAETVKRRRGAARKHRRSQSLRLSRSSVAHDGARKLLHQA